MSRRLITTVLIDNHRNDDTPNTRKARECSVECWRMYAEKVGAELHVMDKQHPAFEGLDPTYARIKAYQELLPNFDLGLFVDCDILVRPEAPDIFEKIPEGVDYTALDCVTYNAAAYTNLGKSIKERAATAGLPTDNWSRHQGATLYFNSGVVLLRSHCSKLYQTIDVPKARELDQPYPEQNYTNWLLNTSGLKYCDMNPKFNWMAYVPPAARLNGWFIHYAGAGWKHETGINRYDMMVDDFKKLYPNKTV